MFPNSMKSPEFLQLSSFLLGSKSYIALLENSGYGTGEDLHAPSLLDLVKLNRSPSLVNAQMVWLGLGVAKVKGV
jgi:hypothetical protein